MAQTGDETVNGSIIEILSPMAIHPLVRTIVSGLPNVGDPDEGEFVGVSGISILGNGANFGLYAIMAADPQQTGDPAFGNLLRVNHSGGVDTLVNVGSFDYDWTADHIWLCRRTSQTRIPTGCSSCPVTPTWWMLVQTRSMK